MKHLASISSFIKTCLLTLSVLPLIAGASDDHHDSEQKVKLLSFNQLSRSNSNATSYSTDFDSDDSDPSSNKSHHYEPPLNLLGLLPEIWDTVGEYLAMIEALNFAKTSREFYKLFHTSPHKVKLLETKLQIQLQEYQNPFFTESVAHKLNILTEVTKQVEDMRNEYHQLNRPDLVDLVNNLFATAKEEMTEVLDHAAKVRFSPTFKLTDAHEDLHYLAEIYSIELALKYPFISFFRSYLREKYYFTGAISAVGVATVGSFFLYQYFHTHPYYYQYPMDVQETFLNQTEMPLSSVFDYFLRSKVHPCFGCKHRSFYANNNQTALYANFYCGAGGSAISGNLTDWIESVTKEWGLDSTSWSQYALTITNKNLPLSESYPIHCSRSQDNDTLGCGYINSEFGRLQFYLKKATGECAANTVLNERMLVWKIHYTVYHISFAALLFVYILMPFLSWWL